MSHGSKLKVLITHDNGLLAAGIAATLRAGEEFEPFVREPVARDMQPTAAAADLVVTDFDGGLKWMSYACSRIAVLILTHHDGEAHIRMALELGVRGYLSIGCSTAEFTEALRAISRGGMALAPFVTARMAESLTRRRLTSRELTVLRILMLGLSNKAIALQLAVSEGTVKTHMKAICGKLNASGRAEAIAIAQQRGLVYPREHAANSELTDHSVRARPLLMDS
jgi:DNA-binding NarL/FixJ family response regulator